jgi:hypothetical protein
MAKKAADFGLEPLKVRKALPDF